MTDHNPTGGGQPPSNPNGSQQPNSPQQPGYPQQPPQQPGYPPQQPGYPQQPTQGYPQRQPGYPQQQSYPQQQQGYPQQQQGYPQQQQAYPQQYPNGYAQQPQQGYPQPGPAPKRPRLIAGLITGGAVLVIGAVVAVMAMMGVFSVDKADADPKPAPVSTDTDEPEVSEAPAPVTEDPDPSPAPTVDTAPRDPSVPFEDYDVDWEAGSAEAFAERDQLFIDQQLPLDGSLLEATTPEQKAFITRQREFVESQGSSWSAEMESFYLALTMDACETSILNAHDVDKAVYEGHLISSPLYTEQLASLTGAQKEAGSQNLESVMLFGMTYLCQGDVNDWATVYESRYGEKPNIY